MLLFDNVNILDGLSIFPDFVENSHGIHVRHLWVFGIASLLHSFWALTMLKHIYGIVGGNCTAEGPLQLPYPPVTENFVALS